MSDHRLPPGWAPCEVQELAADEPAALTDGPFGSNLKTSHYTHDGPRVIRLQNVGDGGFQDARAHISEEHFSRLRKHEAKADDIVIAMLGEALPRACIVPGWLGPAIVKADCVRLRVHPQIALPSLVAAGLNSFHLRRQAADLMHGVGRPRLGLKWFRGLKFHLPPLPEQHRIVAAIESYFTRLDAAEATLERVQRNLKRHRASVLKAAMEGRLVPTEAELAQTEGRNYEPAPVLLERILAERRRRWEEAELAKMKAKGKTPKNDKWKAKYKEPVPPDTTDLPELPEGWCWASPDQLAAPENYSLGIGPFGSNLKVSDYREDGVPLVFVRSIRGESFGRADSKFVSDDKAKELLPHIAVGGDLLITKMGEPPGDACLYPMGLPDAIITADCIRWRLHRSLETNRFFVAAIHSPLVRTQIIGITKGVAQKKVSLAGFKTTAIPLPPLAEQARVALEVERLLSISDATDQTVGTQATHCTRLRHAILKWAFEGRLADQDPKDEPASVLLDHINAEREAAGPTKKTKHRGRPRKKKGA